MFKIIPLFIILNFFLINLNFAQDIPQTSTDSTDFILKKDSVKTYVNSLEVSYRYEYYPQFSDRTYASLQYGRKFKDVDVFVRALRFGINETSHYLFGTEAYWKFKKGGYSYFDISASNSTFLPNFRARAEIFQNIKKFEYSLGAGVVKPYQYKAIPLVTGTLGYYFSHYYVYARPTFSLVDDGLTKSIFIQGRRYLNDTDFLAISLLRGADTGTAREMNATLNNFGLDTYLARFSTQIKRGRFKYIAGIDYGGFYIPQREKFMNFTGVDLTINWSF
jgi:YaiO family outer membrane protein